MATGPGIDMAGPGVINYWISLVYFLWIILTVFRNLTDIESVVLEHDPAVWFTADSITQQQQPSISFMTQP